MPSSVATCTSTCIPTRSRPSLRRGGRKQPHRTPSASCCPTPSEPDGRAARMTDTCDGGRMTKAIDPALFRETLGHYPTGVAVVTAVAEDGNPAGMVVWTFSSVSLQPPLIAFFPATSSGSFAHLRTARTFCINVLASDQEPLCRRLATGGAAKFDGVRWRPATLGSPILEDAVSWIECTFEDIREAGDHYIVLGRVHELAVERSTLPLLFFQGGYGRFSPGSFGAAPDPELIQAAQLAEPIRSQVEALSTELGVNCSVVARVRW